jgi:hypothetical protein
MTDDDSDSTPDLTADDAAEEPDAFTTTRGLSYRFETESPD